MAAADIIKIQNYVRGKVTEVVIYSPETNLLAVSSSTADLTIGIYTNGYGEINLTFTSRDFLDTFLSDLDTAILSGSGTVTLSNQAPVPTTTTTTSTSTTTTTSSTTTTTTLVA